MIIDLVNKMIKPVMIIGLISFTITWVFNIQNQLITEQVYNGITIKVFDLRSYLININNSWDTNALNFRTIIPSRQFISTGNFIEDISNNLLCVFDWLYFPINFILYIIRWISWIIRIALAIIGWNTGTDANGNYYSQLVEILSWITQNLFIPYV